MKTNKQSGFTLVELAIVLVIIGLIVGGVLVGQDLIKAAQIRAGVSQIEKTDAAVNTFRGKYNGLPGDLANCTNFFAAADCTTNVANAGNGILEDFSGTRVLISGEVAGFWHQLYKASLIGDNISDTAAISANAAPATIATAVPSSKVGSGNFLLAYTGGPLLPATTNMSGVNLYRISALTGLVGAVPTVGKGLTPLEAYQVDVKKDDGAPNTGTVIAADSANFNIATDTFTAADSTTACVSVTPANAYNTGTTNGGQNGRNCELMMRTSF